MVPSSHSDHELAAHGAILPFLPRACGSWCHPRILTTSPRLMVPSSHSDQEPAAHGAILAF
jgi:hypothetical protein